MRATRNCAFLIMAIGVLVGSRMVSAQQWPCYQISEDWDICETDDLGTQCVGDSDPGNYLCNEDLPDTCDDFCSSYFGEYWDVNASYCDWSSEYQNGIFYCVDDYWIHCECTPIPPPDQPVEVR